MPALPTLNVDNQDHWNRLLAAFGRGAEYRKWLRNALREEVTRREARALQDSTNADIETKRIELGSITEGLT
jgi:hypothetical protein